jgi:hypothetical protein
VTARLLECDPQWSWEPLATDDTGRPLFDRDDAGRPVGLWIRLTVGGVTRLGYGDCRPDAPSPIKELIGDAIRNASMRYGVALDLWKHSRHGVPQGNSHSPQGKSRAAATPATRADRTDIRGHPCPECGGGLVAVTRPSGGRFIGHAELGSCTWKPDPAQRRQLLELVAPPAPAASTPAPAELPVRLRRQPAIAGRVHPYSPVHGVRQAAR